MIEVVVALVVLEIAVLGVLGTLLAASDAWRRAEQVERDVGRFASVVDSLRGADSIMSDSTPYPGGVARWSAAEGGAFTIEITSSETSLRAVRDGRP